MQRQRVLGSYVPYNNAASAVSDTFRLPRYGDPRLNLGLSLSSLMHLKFPLSIPRPFRSVAGRQLIGF